PTLRSSDLGLRLLPPSFLFQAFLLTPFSFVLCAALIVKINQSIVYPHRMEARTVPVLCWYIRRFRVEEYKKLLNQMLKVISIGTLFICRAPVVTNRAQVSLEVVLFAPISA